MISTNWGLMLLLEKNTLHGHFLQWYSDHVSGLTDHVTLSSIGSKDITATWEEGMWILSKQCLFAVQLPHVFIIKMLSKMLLGLFESSEKNLKKGWKSPATSFFSLHPGKLLIQNELSTKLLSQHRWDVPEMLEVINDIYSPVSMSFLCGLFWSISKNPSNSFLSTFYFKFRAFAVLLFKLKLIKNKVAWKTHDKQCPQDTTLFYNKVKCMWPMAQCQGVQGARLQDTKNTQQHGRSWKLLVIIY